MKIFMFVIIFAALTSGESTVVLTCLIFSVILLIISGFKIWHRLTDLEDVVYSGDLITQKAKKIFDDIKDDTKHETT